MERSHQKALKAKDKALKAKDAVVATVRRDLHDSKEAVQELTATLKGSDQGKEMLSRLITCRQQKRFDDGVFMVWPSNGQNLNLSFYPKPKEVLARFWEKNKRLDAALEERRGPRLPYRAN
uniref:Uncharacterized protein n=1 Tax=Cannabis sativa TaxID=3483 RepID=A0A803Q7D8_CANSA